MGNDKQTPKSEKDPKKSIPAKPIITDKSDEIVSKSIPKTPIYDLPEKKEKTKLEYYEPSEKKIAEKPKELMTDDIPEWQELKPKEEEMIDPKNKLLMGKGKQQAKPISSDEEESEFSPVESQRPSYELPERRQKSKLLYYEPSEQEGKTKNKPLLKEETPDWEKHKQRDEKSPDPKQNIQIGKGRGTDKIPEKDLNLIKKQGELFPEDDKPMQLKPFDSAKPSTKDETKYMPYSTEKKGSEIEKRTPKNTERQHEKPDSAKPTSSDEEESEFSPVESQRPSYELPERRQKSKLLFYEASE